MPGINDFFSSLSVIRYINLSQDPRPIYYQEGILYDLNVLLAECKLYFERDVDVHICWADLTAENYWACIQGTADGNFIAISNTLKRAPKYVLIYLILHELLHLWIRAVKRGDKIIHHPPHYRIAERFLPKFREANSWLENKQNSLVTSK
jgi:hypothetical protein